MLLVDGIRSNDAIYDQASIGREFLIDIDLIERIEYVPGSSSSIYGSNAFFGVINVIIKSGSAFSRPYGAIQFGSAGERKAQVSVGVRRENGAQRLAAAEGNEVPARILDGLAARFAGAPAAPVFLQPRSAAPKINHELGARPPVINCHEVRGAVIAPRTSDERGFALWILAV